VSLAEKIRTLFDRMPLRERVRVKTLEQLNQRPLGQQYQGTANTNAVAKRRARNKVARHSRQINRRRR